MEMEPSRGSPFRLWRASILLRSGPLRLRRFAFQRSLHNRKPASRPVIGKHKVPIRFVPMKSP